MELYFQQMEELVKKSSLAPDEQEEILGALAMLENEALGEMLELFESNSSWIEVIYQNYIDKCIAFSSEDTNDIQDILQSEEALLTQFDGKE